jgi:hypothetical protein
MVKKKPPREVTFPIRPHWFSVGLFAAGILRRIRTGQDEEKQTCRFQHVQIIYRFLTQLSNTIEPLAKIQKIVIPACF